jgi:hypothetical protein
VRKFLAFIVLILGIFTACKQSPDSVVAEAFHHKLYASEVIEKIPYAVSKEDSLLFIEQYVKDWVLHQTLLAQAKKALTKKEQNFSSQIAQYEEKLLIDSYLQKICRDPSTFSTSHNELADFLNATKTDEIPEYREMLKLNYIKLSNPSKLYKKIKELFFEENDRGIALQQLEAICADTIEYYLDDAHWFYTDFLEKELHFSFQNKNLVPNAKFDFVQDGNRFLVFIVDKKQQLQTKNLEDIKMAQLLLQQQKRTEFLINYQDSLVQKALLEKKAIVYPINF